MPKRSSISKRDVDQLAASILKAAIGDPGLMTPRGKKNPAAVALGKLGGLKGGKARAKSLSADKRTQIAKKAAKARWKKKHS